MKFYVLFVLVIFFIVAGGTKRISGQSISRDLLSPEIVIVSPGTSDVTTRHDTIFFKGIVLSYKLRLTEIVFLVNGKVFDTRKPDPQSPNRFQFDIPIPLAPGPNRITIVARNEKGESKVDSGQIVFEKASVDTKPLLAVLSIGLSTYADSSLDLPFAESDANAFARQIAAQADCVFRETQVKVLVGKEATRLAILRGLDWLNKAAASPDDVRLVFISGRAAKDDSGSYYLLSNEHYLEGDLDGSDIRDETLWKRLTASAGPVLLFMDRVMASFVMPGPPVAMSPPPNITAIINPAFSKPQFGSHTSNHGAFTFTLLEGLSKKADASDDRIVDIQELLVWMQRQLPEVTKPKQQPLFWSEPNRKPASVFCVP